MATDPPLMHADDTLSPVDLPAPDAEERHPLRWTSVSVFVAAAFLLLFNAETLDGWAQELPPGPMAEQLTAVTGVWAKTTGGVGLNAPHAAMHAAWKHGEAARFPD